MGGIFTEEELGRVPVPTIRATSKPSPYRGQSSGITARGTEPQGVMVRGHEGPWRVPSTHVVLRAGLLQECQGSCQWRPSASVRGVCERCLFLCSSRVDLHPRCDSVVRRYCSMSQRMEENTLVLQVLMNLFWTSEPS